MMLYYYYDMYYCLIKCIVKGLWIKIGFCGFGGVLWFFNDYLVSWICFLFDFKLWGII